MQARMIVLYAALAVALIAPLSGCGTAESKEEHAQRLNGERLARIAKTSGGVWEKVSDDDRQFLIIDIAHGSEQSARAVILPPDRLKQMLAGKAQQ